MNVVLDELLAAAHVPIPFGVDVTIVAGLQLAIGCESRFSRLIVRVIASESQGKVRRDGSQ